MRCTLGLVKAFQVWQLEQGYSIESINGRWSTVKIHAGQAALASEIFLSSSVTTDTFLVPIPGVFSVQNPDYDTWSMVINGKTDRTLTGPVVLQPKTPGD